MIEIRWHGRGGQGSVVASELLAQAAFIDGKVPQSFPFFGVERRGSPVTAFTRIDDRPISVRTSITAPDVVVVLEAGLLQTIRVTDGLREGGLLLANSALPPDQLEAPVRARAATVDARTIALTHGLGTPMLPIVNTAMLGAFAKATGLVSLDAVLRAIDEFVPARVSENRAAATDGYDRVRLGEARILPGAPRPIATHEEIPLPDGPVASTPSDVLRTSAWWTMRPVIDRARCTRCNFCWKFCPDVAIALDDTGYPVIRLEHCKGCGICAEECPPTAIAMLAE